MADNPAGPWSKISDDCVFVFMIVRIHSALPPHQIFIDQDSYERSRGHCDQRSQNSRHCATDHQRSNYAQWWQVHRAAHDARSEESILELIVDCVKDKDAEQLVP